MDKLYRNIMIVAGVLLVLTVGVFGVVMPLIEYEAKPAYLDILVMPSGAKVEIDGREYRNAVYEFEPGVYTATVSRSGAETKTVELDLKKNETVGLYLRVKSDGSWKTYTAEELAKRNAVSSVMPIEFAMCGEPAKRTNCDAITVKYDKALHCKDDYCLVISGRKEALSDEALGRVREELNALGYDFDDYQYVYVQNEEK